MRRRKVPMKPANVRAKLRRFCGGVTSTLRYMWTVGLKLLASCRHIIISDITARQIFT